jgi:hypothetical protein
MLDEDLAALLARTQRHTGLRGFVGKISDSKTSKTDLLYAVQTRSQQYKRLTTESLDTAIGTRLISLDAQRGNVFPVTTTFPKFGLPETVRQSLRSSERLGLWFGEITIYEVGSILRVAF